MNYACVRKKCINSGPLALEQITPTAGTCRYANFSKPVLNHSLYIDWLEMALNSFRERLSQGVRYHFMKSQLLRQRPLSSKTGKFPSRRVMDPWLLT